MRPGTQAHTHCFIQHPGRFQIPLRHTSRHVIQRSLAKNRLRNFAGKSRYLGMWGRVAVGRLSICRVAETGAGLLQGAQQAANSFQHLQISTFTKDEHVHLRRKIWRRRACAPAFMSLLIVRYHCQLQLNLALHCLLPRTPWITPYSAADAAAHLGAQPGEAAPEAPPAALCQPAQRVRHRVHVQCRRAG
jgi:hypothetical protein